MLYGYSRKGINDNDFFELQEVTFSMSPEVLRAVSLFLKDMADMMDNGGFEDCSHRHVESSIPNWNDLCPGTEIIVLKPK